MTAARAEARANVNDKRSHRDAAHVHKRAAAKFDSMRDDVRAVAHRAASARDAAAADHDEA
ncbi:hypothetical protein GCM10027053_11440 [Intrasporangium mesophilum]